MNNTRPYYKQIDMPITSISRLISSINKFRKTEVDKRQKIYFRGQPDYSFLLKPNIGRENYTKDYELDILHRFQRRAYEHFNRIPTDWETILLAQHYGLSTRLLDWTRNPLVALFWACQKKDADKNKDADEGGAVYSFVRNINEQWDLNIFEAPLYRITKNSKYSLGRKFGIKGVKIIYPFHVTQRITAHGGLFTIQDDPTKSIDKDYTEYYKQYKGKDFDIVLVRKWKVPENKATILEELDYYGINIYTLYADLDSLTKSIIGRPTPERR